MSTEKKSKINRLLELQPSCTVLTTKWLTNNGYSLDLLKRYRNSNWLKPIGYGAMIRAGDNIDYLGGIYALQEQLNLSIHPGGKTALSILGKSHYLSFNPQRVYLFGRTKERLPTWFSEYDWKVYIDFRTTDFLPGEIGYKSIDHREFSLKISSPERAIMECLYLVPAHQELLECFEIMEGLGNLRPKVLQNLLEECSSVKVKRLFLYLAEKVGHFWFKYLEIDKVDLGRGKRSIVKNGSYNNKYKITVPSELTEND